jgi:DNA-binding PadR family transcriptional regulator
MNNRLLKLSPLTEATYYILLSLMNPLHGYGIIKKVEEMSEGRVKLAAGTLYGAISKLIDYKLISLIEEDKENPRRKIYMINSLGVELLNYEINRLNEMTLNGIKEMGDKYEEG